MILNGTTASQINISVLHLIVYSLYKAYNKGLRVEQSKYLFNNNAWIFLLYLSKLKAYTNLYNKGRWKNGTWNDIIYYLYLSIILCASSKDSSTEEEEVVDLVLPPPPFGPSSLLNARNTKYISPIVAWNAQNRTMFGHQITKQYMKKNGDYIEIICCCKLCR